MTGAPRQACPQGHNSRIIGDPTQFARLTLILALAAALMVQGLAVSGATAQDRQPAPVRHIVVAATDSLEGSGRDSLLLQIRRYSHIVDSLRDSLDTEGGIELSEAQRERFHRSIDDISVVIEQISSELGDMELQIEDNTISLLDAMGDGIIIRIPENLDEKLSEGLEAITHMVLQEFPDTLHIESRQHKWAWPGTHRPEPYRTRIIEGNIVKVGDDLLVAEDEDVRGNVVLISGSAEIMGRVDGDVVVVFGDLRLAPHSEVTGKVVTVGGRLDQEKGAEVSDVVVIDPLGSRRGWGPSFLLDQGWNGFLACQGIFLVWLAVALVAAVAAPAQRFRYVVDGLGRQPASAAGVGVMVAMGGHVVVGVLAAILVLTVIGLPLALLLALTMLIVGAIAVAVVAAYVGESVCRRAAGCPSRWMAVLVGMFILHITSFLGGLLGQIDGLSGLAIGLTALGAMLKLLAYAAGLGALTLSRFGGQASSP